VRHAQIPGILQGAQAEPNIYRRAMAYEEYLLERAVAATRAAVAEGRAILDDPNVTIETVLKLLEAATRLHSEAAEAKVRAERQLGQLLNELEAEAPAGQGRKPKGKEE
jgi:hypothetical protein